MVSACLRGRRRDLLLVLGLLFQHVKRIGGRFVKEALSSDEVSRRFKKQHGHIAGQAEKHGASSNEQGSHRQSHDVFGHGFLEENLQLLELRDLGMEVLRVWLHLLLKPDEIVDQFLTGPQASAGSHSTSRGSDLDLAQLVHRSVVRVHSDAILLIGAAAPLSKRSTESTCSLSTSSTR